MNRSCRLLTGRSVYVLTALVSALWLTLYSNAAHAQNNWKQGKDMRRAVRRVVDFGNNVVRAKEKQNVNLGFLDFGPFSGAYLKDGQSIYEGFLLKPKTQYFFLVAFDDQAVDFTLSLRRESDGKEVTYSGTNVRAVTQAKRVASIIYTPTKEERYRVTIGLKKANGGGSCVGLAILHKGGVRVPVETLYTVTNHCLDICENFTLTLAKDNYTSSFYSGQNVWAVIGAFVKPGFRVMSDPKPYKSGVMTVVGAGQKGMGDVNLFLLGDTADGNGEFPVVASETKQGNDGGQPWSGIVHETQSGTYMIGMENGGAQNEKAQPGLIVGATLTVEAPPEAAKPPVKPDPEPDKPEPEKPEPEQPGKVKTMRMAGTWKHNENGNTGTLDFTVVQGGNLTGKLTIDKKELKGDFTGTFSYTDMKAHIDFQIKDSYSAKMVLSLNDKDHLVGTMNFYDTDGKKVGSAEVDLEIKEVTRE